MEGLVVDVSVFYHFFQGLLFNLDEKQSSFESCLVFHACRQSTSMLMSQDLEHFSFICFSLLVPSCLNADRGLAALAVLAFSCWSANQKRTLSVDLQRQELEGLSEASY